METVASIRLLFTTAMSKKTKGPRQESIKDYSSLVTKSYFKSGSVTRG